MSLLCNETKKRVREPLSRSHLVRDERNPTEIWLNECRMNTTGFLCWVAKTFVNCDAFRTPSESSKEKDCHNRVDRFIRRWNSNKSFTWRAKEFILELRVPLSQCWSMKWKKKFFKIVYSIQRVLEIEWICGGIFIYSTIYRGTLNEILPLTHLRFIREWR